MDKRRRRQLIPDESELAVFMRNISGLRPIHFLGWMLLGLVGCVILTHLSCSRPSDKKTPPNIVFIIADALRKDHLQVYGYRKNTTPHLSARLENGIVFSDYFSNGSQTLSTHFSILSGELSSQPTLKVEKSFVQDLKTSGYRTYGVSANPLVGQNLNYSLGFDSFNANVGAGLESRPEIVQKKDAWDRLCRFVNPMSRFLKIHLTTTADVVNEQVFLMLKDHFRGSCDRPFFLFINYLETHDPYFPHSAVPPGVNYNIRDEGGLFYDFLRRAPQFSKTEIQAYKTLYDNEIIYLDGHLQRLWNFLKRREDLRKTVFILTADHGEMLGEHNLYTHDFGLYKEEIEIPFIVFGPGIKGRRIPGLYSQRNTPEIIKDLAAGKLDDIGKREEPFLVHRHYATDTPRKTFLPVFCQVDLLRITFPRYSVFYYRQNNRDTFVAQENESGKEWKRPISKEDREILEKEIGDFQGTLGQKRALSKSLEDQLRSLGYIR